MKRHYLSCLLASILAAGLVSGCGGGGGGAPAASDQGRGSLVLRFEWPQRSRFIPRAANSISVVVSNGSGFSDSRTVDRPPGGGFSTVEFSSVPTGSLNVVATAFPQAGAQGVPLAVGTVVTTVTAGQSATATADLGSTIDRLVLNESAPSLNPGAALQLVATPLDSAGSVVLIPADGIAWISDDPLIVAVSDAGLVTAVAPGTVTVRAVERESGKVATATVTVTSVPGGLSVSFANPPISVAIAPTAVSIGTNATHQFTATVSGIPNQVVVWRVQEPTGGKITTAGLYTAPAGAGTYHVTAASTADPTKGASATVTVSAGAGPIGFAAPVSYSVPSAGCLAARDLDGDTFLDLAVSSVSAGQAHILWGKGDGTFVTGPILTMSGSGQVLPVDVNADGRPDLVVCEGEGSRLALFLNAGGRSFGAASYLQVGTKPYGVAAGDFNGDGKPDLASANNGSATFSILLNQGGGVFGAASSQAAGGTYPAQILADDLNGDGKVDLAISIHVNNKVALFSGNGTGGFTASGSYGVGSYPSGFARGDYNGDGKLDLAVANTWSHNVSILFGAAPGSFSLSPYYAAQTYPGLVSAADLDGDGDLDLAMSNNGADYFTVLVNSGTGVFGAPLKFTSGGENSRNLAVGDFNRDGKPDIAVGSQNTNNITVHIHN